MSANHPWIVSRAMNGRSLLSRKPVRFRICAGVSFRLECSERARFGRSDISMATKCFFWAIVSFLTFATIRKQKQFRSTMKDSLNDTFSRCLCANSTLNGQPIRPADRSRRERRRAHPPTSATGEICSHHTKMI